jgi:hypothetical protein
LVDDRDVVEGQALFFFVVSPEAVAGSGQGENSNDCDETHDAHERSATVAGECDFVSKAMTSPLPKAAEWGAKEKHNARASRDLS